MKPFSDNLTMDLKPTDDRRPRPMGEEWVGIIIHHTAIGGHSPSTMTESVWRSLNENIARWIQKRDDVSAHFQIGRFGELTQFVDPRYDLAYHAGKSEWFHPTKRAVIPDWNRYAIGIELLGDGNKGQYSDAQYEVLTYLCRELMSMFRGIDPRCITGHENIAPGRKQDPGICFDWQRLFKGIYAD